MKYIIRMNTMDDCLEFEIPRNWFLDTSGRDETLAVLFSPNSDSTFRANVTVVSENGSVHSVAKRTSTQIFSMAGVVPNVRQGIGRETTKVLEWETNAGVNSLWFHQLIVQGTTCSYVFTVTSLLSDKLGIAIDVSQLLNSISVSPSCPK